MIAHTGFISSFDACNAAFLLADDQITSRDALKKSVVGEHSIKWEGDTPMNIAGPAIRKARREKGLTQKELAALSGMAQSDISRVEGEKGNPSVEILERIAQGIGMKLLIEFVPLREEKAGTKSKGKKTK